MKQNVEEQPVIVQIVNGPNRQYIFDESCIALTGRDEDAQGEKRTKKRSAVSRAVGKKRG